MPNISQIMNTSFNNLAKRNKIERKCCYGIKDTKS